jgi:hypothetical protein
MSATSSIRASGLPVSPPDEIDITNASSLRAVLAPRPSAVMPRSWHDPGPVLRSHRSERLLLAHKLAVAESGELQLVIPSAVVLRVLAVTGIDRQIPSFARLDGPWPRRTPPGPEPSRRA